MTEAAAFGPEEPDEEGPEPVEVLVGLAERGEIDPWDIDIIQVTDAFLAAIDEAEIRTSGRALFYASVLLRMKSDELFVEDEDPEPDEPERVDPFAGDTPLDGPETGVGDPIDQLEAEMDRRLERQSARGTPETLDELVHELREAERGSWWKSGRSYDTENSPKGFQRGVQTLDYRSGDDTRSEGEPEEADVTGTAHDEDIDELIEAVEAELHERYDRGRAEVLFAEIADAGGSRVDTFLALLFLAHRGAVFLDQDELFGDLWIEDRRSEEPPTAETDVSADGEKTTTEREDAVGDGEAEEIGPTERVEAED
ncbi:ScpA family protein [Halodesulfurarchaeum sp. HSR-GB]|uniref:ScpA family protein n=1 Tax=Halodesulfurarchaeum sp. HSR-GB TaxID=3074077 RepID=UPI0028585611|nr:ScpA family protein [Halodesulfurarchaeum sp. HSR-GB]MDR5656806.1 ScpA family protein [Halodesulfurarchaeum sp. HSR-GB]